MKLRYSTIKTCSIDNYKQYMDYILVVIAEYCNCEVYRFKFKSGTELNRFFN